MSESYKLPTRRNRSRPEDPQHRQNMLSHDKPGRWSHDKHDLDDPEDDSHVQPDLRRQSRRVERALRDTGLDSSDEGGKDEDEHPAQHHQKKKKKDDRSQNHGEKARGEAIQQGQEQDPSGSNPFGALVRGRKQDDKQNRCKRALHLPAVIPLNQCFPYWDSAKCRCDQKQYVQR